MFKVNDIVQTRDTGERGRVTGLVPLAPASVIVDFKEFGNSDTDWSVMAVADLKPDTFIADQAAPARATYDYTVSFWHIEAEQVDQELFRHQTEDVNETLALNEAVAAYVFNNHDRALINRIIIDLE